MSTSAIQCRECQHTLAKRHHTGRVLFEVGIVAALLPDGRTQAICPCGHRQTMYANSPNISAAPLDEAAWPDELPKGNINYGLDYSTGMKRRSG